MLCCAVLAGCRYRVACGLKALTYISASSVVLVHDWTLRSRIYGKPLLQFYDMVQQADRLAVLKRRDDWDPVAAAKMLQKYYTVVERK